jgi:aminopeptidase N
MENAACVTFHERAVFRSRVTDAQRMLRAETILHEMAHMWFGDLVTPIWWDDLWLNETFAEYMGFAASVAATRFKTAWIKFAASTEAGARDQDQRPTTHPIVADVPDVESATLNLDLITYNKGASVIKQLVAWVGEEAFFKGVQTYFKANAYRNTELSDFLGALEKASGRDLTSWSRAWLETAGVNTLDATLEPDGGRIKSVTLQQHAVPDHPTLRPHRLRVGLFDLSGSILRRRRSVELDIDGAATQVLGLAGEQVPDLLLVNDGDLTYAKVHLDERSLATLKDHLRDIEDPLARTMAWGALWDMLLDAGLRARDFATITLNNISAETDPSILSILIARIEQAIAVYGDPSRRAVARALLAGASKERLDRSAPGSDTQLLWANAFIGAARDAGDIVWINGLLDGTTTVKGLVVDFEVRWRAVNALATIGVAGEDLIAAELKRDPTDEGRRAATAARAAQPVAAAKEQAWRTVMHEANTSGSTRRAIAGGFHRTDQEDLLRAFVAPYFDSLIPTWESHGSDQAISIIEWMYPRAVLTEDVVTATDQALGHDLPGPIRRSLVESQDAIKRALRAQALDRT